MKITYFHIILLLITFISLFGWVRSCDRNKDVITSSSTKIDTVFITKVIHDTVKVTDVREVYVDRIVKDTVYIDVEDGGTISLPVVQKHYQDTALYDLWISGVEPLKMDSMSIYTKTVISNNTIYKDKVVYKESKGGTIYVGGGFYSFSDTFIPNIGISVPIGQKWLISANCGFNGKMYDINVKYKLF